MALQDGSWTVWGPLGRKPGAWAAANGINRGGPETAGIGGESVKGNGQGWILGDPNTPKQEEEWKEEGQSEVRQDWEGKLQRLGRIISRARSTWPNALERKSTGPHVV